MHNKNLTRSNMANFWPLIPKLFQPQPPQSIPTFLFEYGTLNYIPFTQFIIKKSEKMLTSFEVLNFLISTQSSYCLDIRKKLVVCPFLTFIPKRTKSLLYCQWYGILWNHVISIQMFFTVFQ